MRHECPFCHQRVWIWNFHRHCQAHAERRPDGQQKDHVSVAPEQRYTGSLEGVPCVYVHEVCGGSTGMPEEIIRSYLVNPFLYNDSTFCTCCGDYFPLAEMQWIETGENLQDYIDQLRQQKPQR